jgi:hypothetical protein
MRTLNLPISVNSSISSDFVMSKDWRWAWLSSQSGCDIRTQELIINNEMEIPKSLQDWILDRIKIEICCFHRVGGLPQSTQMTWSIAASTQ